MSLKDRISSPLEAGTSILGAHHLPPHLTPALEYVSNRLAKKGLHLTLIVARRDYQLPAIPPPMGSPGRSTPVPVSPISPRMGFSASPVAVFKQLVRTGSNLGQTATRARVASPSSSVPSSASSQTWSASDGIGNSWLRWHGFPSPLSPPPPMTPCTVSSATTDSNIMFGPVSPGILRLIYPSGLPAAEERQLRIALERAESKFNTSGSSLSPPASPSACGITPQLMQSSIAQNEVLFSSEGLSLISFDRLYSLKSALSAYSKTGSPLRLEDAVDELRRLILANNGCKVTRSDLLRSYDWLSVSHSAINDLDLMYRRAYGGPDKLGAISGLTNKKVHSLPSPQLVQPIESADSADIDVREENGDETDFLMCTIQICKPPSPRLPVLRLQTSFDKPPQLGENGGQQEQQELDSDSTPRAADSLPIMLQPWSHSIDQLLSADVLSPNRNSMRVGPVTPNGYDDISPITRGEWGFLMVDKALEGSGRTVAVENW